MFLPLWGPFVFAPPGAPPSLPSGGGQDTPPRRGGDPGNAPRPSLLPTDSRPPSRGGGREYLALQRGKPGACSNCFSCNKTRCKKWAPPYNSCTTRIELVIKLVVNNRHRHTRRQIKENTLTSLFSLHEFYPAAYLFTTSCITSCITSFIRVLDEHWEPRKTTDLPCQAQCMTPSLTEEASGPRVHTACVIRVIRPVIRCK